MNHFIAVDLGATSGRVILFSLENHKFHQREIARFDNPIIQIRGRYCWDIYGLYNNIVSALRKVADMDIRPVSIGIDTWGVDFALIRDDGEILALPRCYRDPYTNGIPRRFGEVVPPERVYELTGTQVMNFNTLYQLYALHLTGDRNLAEADRILFMPDALSYLLTGNSVTERTIASTSNFYNPETGKIEQTLLSAFGLRDGLFPPMVDPGTVIGRLTDDVQRLTGLADLPVVAVAGHDTASAVAAVPAQDGRFAYLSSGTWSLMGIETPQAIITPRSREENFTNEGGVFGTTRFLKNICGMWLMERCRQEWGEKAMDYDTLISQAKASVCDSVFNPDDPRLANPDSMVETIQRVCAETGQQVPENQPEFARCIFRSLARRYADVMELLQSFAPFPVECLHIIGGGSRNEWLNQLTANATGLPVVAGPVECTAIGNMLMQAHAAGLVASLGDMRQIVAQNVETKTYLPEQ